MEKLTPEQDHELLDYLDGSLTENQRTSLEQRLASSLELRNRLHELRQLTHFLQKENQLELPASNFTNQLMAKVVRLPARSVLSPRNGLMLFAGMVITVVLLSLLVSDGVFDQMTELININSWSVTERIKSPGISIPVGFKPIIRILILLNIVLAFVLLDRTILKPFFKRG